MRHAPARAATGKARAMSGQTSNLGGAWWAKNLDDIDREVVRQASICGVRILDPGVIERVIQNDATVCKQNNPVAFRKLREAMMLHYSIRERTVGAVGEAATQALIREIVERLQSRVGDSLGRPDPV
jgi:hypothetical protein